MAIFLGTKWKMLEGTSSVTISDSNFINSSSALRGGASVSDALY